jgi:SAM-dependent methyltransferase
MTYRPRYSGEDVAALYNLLNPWGAADDFYLALVMAEVAVLDVGCGTGMMLHSARDWGHTGRLVGIDPDSAALAVARQRPDVTWIEGRAEELAFKAEFNLAIMISHAFQFLVSDEEIHRSLVAIRQALKPGGRFAFETRNPIQRAWADWATSDPELITDHNGRRLMMSYQVTEQPNGVIDLVEVTADLNGEVLREDRAKMRFLGNQELREHLAACGFKIEAQFGDWDRSPLVATSREIITCARAS